jgi:hypothetical protein
LRPLHQAVAAALILLLGPAAHSEVQRWSGIEYYYQPETTARSVYSLESLKAGTERPFGTLHFLHGQYGDAFTKAGACSAFGRPDDDGADATALGWTMRTECAPLADDLPHRFVNMQANVVWKTSERPQPWPSASSRFGMEFSVRIPSAGVSAGARGYATAQVGIHDGDDHFFWLQPVIWLSGFGPGAQRKDAVGTDPSGPYINPVYRDHGRYLSKFDNPRTGQVSRVTRTQPFTAWGWYAFTISRAQLLAAVADLNANGGHFSTDAARYRVGLIGVQTEINRQAGAVGTTPQGWVEIGLKQLHAYRLY